jgi:hypothetical protein
MVCNPFRTDLKKCLLASRLFRRDWSLALNPSIRLRRTSGLKLDPAAILNQNPIFEMGSSKKKKQKKIGNNR